MRSIHKQLIALAIIAPCAASGAMALNDERLNRQLLKLDPQTRLEQTCDTEVMLRINRDRNSFKVDKVIAYAIKDPVVRKYSIKAPGAVFPAGAIGIACHSTARPARGGSTLNPCITRSAPKSPNPTGGN